MAFSESLLPIAGLLTLSATLLPAAPVIPKYGYSVPANTDAAEVANVATECGAKGKLLVLPPIAATLGSAPLTAGTQAQDAMARAVPEGTDVYVRLRLATGGLGQGGSDKEKVVGEQVTQMVARLPLRYTAVHGLVVEIEEPLPPPELFQFVLAELAVKAKGAKESLQVVFSFPDGFLQKHGDLAKRVAVYADAFGTTFGPGWQAEARWVAEQALNKPLFLRLPSGAGTGEQLASQYLDAVTAASGTGVEVVWTDEAETPSVRKACRSASFLAKFITAGFTPMSEAVSPVTVKVPGGGPQRLFAASGTPTVAILGRIGATRGMPKTIDLQGAPGEQFQVEWYDPITGARLNAGAARESASGIGQSCASDSDYLFLSIKKGGAAEQTVFSQVNVAGKAELRVEEVIARWQRQKEAQQQALANYTSILFMNLHFEPANMGSGFDISIRFKQFSSSKAQTEWVQTDFYVNGVRFKRAEFPLPQLEPEKVLTQPLDLRLNEKYSYKLLGTDQVNGAMCYVLGVEPAEANENLYRGKVWIDETTFRQVKMDLRQRGSTGSVIADQETQTYELVPDGKGQEFNLLKSMYAQQTLNAAGRNFILQKTYAYSDFALNVSNFDAQLDAARRSDSPMFRDTEEGLRGLKKEGDQRVVEPGPQKRIRSIVAGLMYEGTFNFPIPLLGYSLVDFDFRHTGEQLSVFWAGPILVGNLSKQYGPKFRLGVDLAASGLPQNNRVYSGNTEVTDQGLWVWEQTTGLRATWQATNSLSLTAASYLAYDLYRGTSDTSKQFTLPNSGVTLMPQGELKYAHSGYLLTTGFYEGFRLGWKEFGLPSAEERVNKDWYKYYGDFSKSFYFGKFTKSAVELSYFGGQQLDRFSRYAPSFFSSPTIRGIPSGTDTFDNIAVATVSHGFNIMDLIKFQAFYNHAWAQNRSESQSYRAFDGLEFEFGTAGPKGTYLQGIMAYALKGNLARYNSRYSVYFLIMKPLK